MHRRNRLRAFTEDCSVLILLNLVFASNYLLSSSDRLLGFMYRQDAYWYMIVVDHLQKLMSEGFAPFGSTWLQGTYCGLPEVICLDPMYSLYLFFQAVSCDFIVSWKLTMFVFYTVSSITMYYLTSVLTSDRLASMVSATAYTFCQLLVFEVFLGHLSMVVGFAFSPLIAALYIKALRNSSRPSTILSAIFLSALLIVRPDLAYFLISFMLFLLLYFLFTTKNRAKTLLNTGVLFLIAFLIAYPFLEPRYLSSAQRLTENIGIYTYEFYSPEPALLFIPSMKSSGVYIGITVLLFCAIGVLIALRWVFRLKRRSSEAHKFSVFLMITAMVYIVLGLGSATPLYGLLYDCAPFFAVFRVPTRWLSIAQLCLAILAGIGASYVVTSLPKKMALRRILSTVLILTIFLDLSIHIAPSIYEHQGWRPVARYDSDSAVFMFPQTSYVPEASAVHDYISNDTTSLCRILSAPIVYSRSYYHYLESLKDSEVNLAYDYVQFRLKSGFQTEVYNGFRYGNFTDSVGEQMALLGVKYLVYNFYWGEWEGMVKKMNRTDDLEFLIQDRGYILYRNKQFGDVSAEHNLIENGGFEEDDDQWLPWHVREGFSEVDPMVSNLGVSSTKLVNTRNDGLAGRTQYVKVGNTTQGKEFKLSGWCKAENVSGENPLLAIRATLAYTDGSYSRSAYARFLAEAHDWQYSSVSFLPDRAKTMDSIVVSFFLRNATGKAWFDDIYLTERRLTDEWSGGYLVRKLHTDARALLSEQNKGNATMNLHRDNAMNMRLHINASEPVHLILSESYDAGWQITSENPNHTLSINEFNSLITLFIDKPGVYNLTLGFTEYYSSLTRILVCHSAASILIATTMISQLSRSECIFRIKNFIRNARMHLLWH